MSMKSLYIAFFLGVLVVHSCMFELAICSTNYTDQLSFLAFKSSIDHDPNNVSTNWTKEINFCNWAGILCSRRRQRVTSLHLWPSLSRVSLPPFLHHHSHHTPHTHDMHSLSLSSPSRLSKPITHNHTAAHTYNTTTFIFMHHLHQPITTIHNTHHHRGHPCTPTRQTNPALSLLSLSHSHAQPTSHTLSAHSSHRRYNTHTWRWMGDPYWRYGAPAERGSIPRPSFPGYLLPEPSSLTSHHLWSSNDLQGIAADFVQKDPGAYGVNDITGVGPGLSDLISKRPGSLARVDGLPVPAKDSNILFVDGLPSDCLRREVGHLFRPFIGFKDIRVVHKEPRHSGDKAMVLCFVEFNDAKCALTAMEALQVALLESRRGQDSAHIGCMKSGVVISEDDFGEVYMEDAFTWV